MRSPSGPDGDKVAVQFVTEGGRPDNFVLRLPNNAVTEDQTVTVSYAVPESGTVIEDTVGNDALAFTYFEATNNSTVDVTPPELASAEVLGSGDRLSLTFNEDLDRTAGVPPASAFTSQGRRRRGGGAIRGGAGFGPVSPDSADRCDQAGPDGHG